MHGLVWPGGDFAARWAPKHYRLGRVALSWSYQGFRERGQKHHEHHIGERFGLLRGRLNRSAGRLRSGKEVMDDQPEVFALFIKPSRGLGNAKLAEKLILVFVV